MASTHSKHLPRLGHRSVAVIVPVHNEEELLANCLASILESVRGIEFDGIRCKIYVVLDACTDRSYSIASSFDVVVLSSGKQSVGAARALGAATAIAAGATWLAFTDADTTVAIDWLSCQLSLGVDVVCGTVGVAWEEQAALARADFLAHYNDREGHQHIHGANLGVSTTAYLEAGGFTDRACHEDVELVESLRGLGRTIAWSAAPRVVTSGRRIGRAPEGFAAAIHRVEAAAHTASAAAA